MVISLALRGLHTAQLAQGRRVYERHQVNCPFFKFALLYPPEGTAFARERCLNDPGSRGQSR